MFSVGIDYFGGNKLVELMNCSYYLFNICKFVFFEFMLWCGLVGSNLLFCNCVGVIFCFVIVMEV